jgi:hypothetical protein
MFAGRKVKVNPGTGEIRDKPVTNSMVQLYYLLISLFCGMYT